MVDEDVDLFDTEDVLWAMTTRFQADKDLVVLPGVAGHVLDPPSPRNTTRPCPPRASLPGWSTTPPGPTVCGPSAETSINGPGPRLPGMTIAWPARPVGAQSCRRS
ncbi:hypothetical protein [Streptomyces sp. NPDC004538]|uniref:hypothetical protein n=1 Tax=Streptomyces sp. NPDC004538 TaxID=3154279 RepID=UPI0033B3DE57